MLSFEKFCNSSFWDESGFSDNSSFPEFTTCFRNTVLVWVPCGWLWLTLPVNIYLTMISKTPRIPVTAFNMAKLISNMVLVVLTVLDTLKSNISEETFSFTEPNVVLASGLINFLTFVLAAIYTQLDRIRGNITSTSLFVFWLLKVVCSVEEFITRILHHGKGNNFFTCILFFLLFGTLILQLVLHSFAEKQSSSIEQSDSNKEMCPEGEASILNLLYFWWMNSIFIRAYKGVLQERDVWSLLPRDQSRTVVDRFDKNWRKELSRTQQINVKRTMQHFYDVQSATSLNEKTPLLPKEVVVKQSQTHKASLFKALLNTFGWTYMLALWYRLLSDILQFAGPLLVSFLIDFADSPTQKPAWKGYLPALGIFVAGVIQSVFYQQNNKLGMAVGMRVRCSLIAAIYKKAMTMNSNTTKNASVGEIVSLMSVDCQRLQDTFTYLWYIFSVPVQVAIGIYLLWGIVGISSLAGLAVLFLLVPLNSLVAFKQLKWTVDVLELKGERIQLMNQILSGIKVLKMYAWEPSFKNKVLEIRKQEINKLIKVAFLQGITTFGFLMAPVVVTLATFATYVVLKGDHYLGAKEAFVALALFNVLRLPVNMLSQTISSVIQARASLKRVSDFLSNEDLDPGNVQQCFDTDYAIRIQRGTFTWDKNSPQSTLRDLHFTIPDGQLVAVVGQVGAGKSSLISAILGELMKIDGFVSVKGSVAYVPQEAWIQNATLMDNILFGKTYMQKKYKRVLEACALTADLDILPGRDLTEIGERGINLSGGQKQRVSLARAVYSNSDVYLMDDPLSAVDAHVGKHIFEKVIGSKGLLKNKTRIFVTHGIHWLPMVDNIIVLVNGRITEIGPYEDLVAHDGPFAQFLKKYFIEDGMDNVDDPEIEKIQAMIFEQVESVTSEGTTSDEQFPMSRKKRKKISSLPKTFPMTAPLTADRLTLDETSQSGGVKLSVYSSYFKALGFWSVIAVILVFSLYHGLSVYANFWLTFWTNDPFLTNKTNAGLPDYYETTKYYLFGYGLLGLVQAVLVFVYAILFSVRMVYASKKLHQDMLDRIMRAPMEFFDTTPIGRIVNRLSSDIEVMDTTLPLTIRITINSVYMAVTTIIVICINTPIILTTIFPVALLYGFVLRFYIPTSRQLKRLESVCRSPIYNHFSETIVGASVIRAYKATERFMEEGLKRLDKNMVFYYAFCNSARWIGVRIELLGNIVVLASALFSVLSVLTDLDGAFVGLSVVYAIQATYVLNLLVMNLSDLQSNIICVERIKEYTEIKTEADWRSERQPPPNWPETGDVIFNNYKMRYRTGTELVLRGLDLKINHNEKIGIVGRTGAGKSSMTLALFRLVEAASGEIVIDGVNINSIGLHDLREKITILPQDPVLFSGSLRQNLDPLHHYSDGQLWTALQQAHLQDVVVNFPGQLDYEFREGGQNLSVGQRQLVCLARTLLKNTKILVLDEATAAVDLATDELIQQIIFKEFQNCTVISIAHRIKTVLDYDRIIVMDKGLIQECGTPNNLLSDENSIFYGLAKEAGVINSGTSSYQEQSERPLMAANQNLEIPYEHLESSHFGGAGLLVMQQKEARNGNESVKSSNGWTTYSDKSGFEASAEFSNGQNKDKLYFEESISLNSVQFGDVTIVTSQPDSPSFESEEFQATPTNIVPPEEIYNEQNGNPDPNSGIFQTPSEQSPEPFSTGDCTIIEESLVANIPLPTKKSSESSCSSDGKGNGNSEKSEYFTADSQSAREDTVLQSPVDQSSADETLEQSGDQQFM